MKFCNYTIFILFLISIILFTFLYDNKIIEGNKMSGTTNKYKSKANGRMNQTNAVFDDF